MSRSGYQSAYNVLPPSLLGPKEWVPRPHGGIAFENLKVEGIEHAVVARELYPAMELPFITGLLLDVNTNLSFETSSAGQ